MSNSTPISMYQASVPVYVQMLTSLSKILDKAAAFAAARKLDPAVLLATRLYPDMFPLSKQIQLVSDFAKGPVSRLAGVEPPKYSDDEKTIEELQARLAKTIDYVKSFKPDQLDASDGRAIELKVRNETIQLTGKDYLLHFALPNLFFHHTTAYAILRHLGLEIGKGDFVGRS